MKKTSNFKLLFEKIHKDNIFRSPYHKKEVQEGKFKSLKGRNSLNQNINLNLSNCRQKQKKSDERNPNQRPKTARPPSSRVPIPLYKQLASQSVKQFTQFIEITQKQIRAYLKNKTQFQIINIKNQLKVILNLCLNLKETQEQIQRKFQSFSLDLSNLLDHRITRIVFYFIYAKILQCNSTRNPNKQIKLLEFCDQYSRSLNILIIALHSCSRIQKILVQQKRFEESKHYAKKTLKLAIHLKNLSQQFKAIEALKILSFYNGALYSSKQNYLSKEERQRIQKSFHPIEDDDLDKQPQFNRIMKQISLSIERVNQQEEDKRLSKNIEIFISNLAVINKDLTDRSKNVMQTIKRVNTFGNVNKYLQRGVYITLQPHSRNLPNKNRQQVLLTHSKKKSQVQTSKKFHKFYLPKFIQMTQALIQNI